MTDDSRSTPLADRLAEALNARGAELDDPADKSAGWPTDRDPKAVRLRYFASRLSCLNDEKSDNATRVVEEIEQIEHLFALPIDVPWTVATAETHEVSVVAWLEILCGRQRDLAIEIGTGNS